MQEWWPTHYILEGMATARRWTALGLPGLLVSPGLNTGQPIRAFAGIAPGLDQPVADGLGRRPERFSQLLGRLASAGQLQDLLPVRRRVRGTRFWHDEHLLLPKL